MANSILKVTNRSGGIVIYSTDEFGRREFAPRETKKISQEELETLAQRNGGPELIYNYLSIESPDAVEEILNVEPAPEYWLTEQQLPTWMKSCSLDEFKDALDYAPDGIKTLIKSLAVSLPLTDSNKREAIKTQLGFDVDMAIKLNSTNTEEVAEPVKSAAPGGRRTQSTIIIPKKADAEEKKTVITIPENKS